MGLTLMERRPMVKELRRKYAKAAKREQGRILDQLESMGHNRSYARRLMREGHGRFWRRAFLKLLHRRDKPAGVASIHHALAVLHSPFTHLPRQSTNLSIYLPPIFGIMAGMQTEVIYKTIGDVDLTAHVFQPAAELCTPRAGIIFFFGGAWKIGSPEQFFPHCERLAARGMVAISAEYRVRSRHDVTPLDCVADAKSAMRWARAHAAELGIDPLRLAAGGGSAGGHLALCTALIKACDDPADDLSISPVPDALVLFNPAADMSGRGLSHGIPAGQELEISPIHHVRSGAPPAIMFHGTADQCVPFAEAQAFADAMQAAGNSCELVAYDGQPHAFFNFKDGGNPCYDDTCRRMEEFLESQNFIVDQ
jgi:acetyl esterase